MIKLKDLLKEQETFTATNKKSGGTSVFDSEASRDAAVKAGTHSKKDNDSEKDDKPKKKKPNMFSKDAGYDAPTDSKSEPTKLKYSKDGKMTQDSADSIEKELNKALGVNGMSDIDLNTGTIEYFISDDSDEAIFIGKEEGGKGIAVSFGDGGDEYKTFKNSKDAVAYAKELGQTLKGEEPKEEPSKYDDASFWKDDERDFAYGGQEEPTTDDDRAGVGTSSEGTQKTTERLDKIDKALNDELKLSKRGFTMARSFSGGGGSFEGPLEISYAKLVNSSDNPEKVPQLSIGSGEQNGKFTIGFNNLDGEPLFDDEYSLTDDDFEPQVAHKMAKEMMKMPEVEKLLKGELSIEEFKPTYDKLKSKFNKSSENESLSEGNSYKNRFKHLANIN